MKVIVPLVGLVTALVGLVAAVVSIYPQLNPSPTPTSQPAAGPRAALSVTVDAPRENEVIRAAVYNDMAGSYDGTLPPGYRLVVLRRDNQNNYYLPAAPVTLNRATRRWAQSGLELPTPGRWQLVVAVANEPASAVFDTRGRTNDRGPFQSLPDGLQAVRTVSVERQ